MVFVFLIENDIKKTCRFYGADDPLLNKFKFVINPSPNPNPKSQSQNFTTTGLAILGMVRLFIRHPATSTFTIPPTFLGQSE